MANTYSNQERGAAQGTNLQLGVTLKAAAAINPWRLVEAVAGEKCQQAAAESTKIIGASMDVGAAANDVETQIAIAGGCPLVVNAPVTAGQWLKADANGKAIPFIDSTLTATTIKTTSAGGAFTNQPANDGVTVVSDGADTRVVTIIGTTNGTNTVVVENITLTGAVAVNSVKVDWGLILAVKVDSASASRTVTVSETSGGLTITTIGTSATSKGVDTVTGYAYNKIPTGVGSGATTKQIGLKGTDSTGAVIYDSKALNGTTAVVFNSAFNTVTEVYSGDLENARTATIKVTATQDDPAMCAAKAFDAQATVGQTVWAKLR